MTVRVGNVVVEQDEDGYIRAYHRARPDVFDEIEVLQGGDLADLAEALQALTGVSVADPVDRPA